MGGGNGQKSKQKQLRNAAKQKAKKGGASQLAENQKAMTIICKVCRQSFMCTVKPDALSQHAENKHPKFKPAECFDSLAETATAAAK